MWVPNLKFKRVVKDQPSLGWMQALAQQGPPRLRQMPGLLMQVPCAPLPKDHPDAEPNLQNAHPIR